MLHKQTNTMQTKTYSDIFGDFDFKQIHNPNFKEDSVREVVILPLLTQLGYRQDSIERSKNLLHPYLKIGSKKRPITLVPDYLLKVHENYALVLDAKAPTEKITEGDNVEQVYSYATHPEIRTTYFALCNGLEFALFRRELTDTPILHFYINEIEHYWEKLATYLSPSSFQTGKDFTYEKVKFAAPTTAFDYNTRPLLAEIETKKQAAKRHFGVHGYFTKQAWNVVQEYIKTFPNQAI